MTVETMVPFVGDSHRALRDSLLELISPREHGFRAVVVEGPSGVGKSRVIREVYAALVAQQPVPQYWPELPLAPRNPLAGRQVLGPGRREFVWEPNALPSFLWWDIYCSANADHDPFDAIWAFTPFLERHLLPTALAQSVQKGLAAEIAADVRNSLRSLIREALEEGGVESLNRLMGSLDVALPGMAWLAHRVASGVQWLKRRQEAHRALQSHTILATSAASANAHAVEQLAAMTAGVLPGVVAIEDLHLMGDDMAGMLTLLQERDVGVTVIASAWPEGRNRSWYGPWRSQYQSSDSVRFVPLASPERAAMRKLVTYLAPETLATDADRVVDTWPNPLALLTLMTLERTERLIRRNHGALAWCDALENEPSRIAELYLAQLRELPTSVARALSIAAGCLPEPPAQGTRFVVDVIIAAAERAELCEPRNGAQDQFRAALEESVELYQWCLHHEPGLSSFRERALQSAARHHLMQEILDPEGWDILRDQVIKVLREFIEARRAGGYILDSSETTNLVASTWLLEMLSDG